MKNQIQKLQKSYNGLLKNYDELNKNSLILLGENDYLKSVNARLEQEIKELKELLNRGVKNEK